MKSLLYAQYGEKLEKLVNADLQKLQKVAELLPNSSSLKEALMNKIKEDRQKSDVSASTLTNVVFSKQLKR